jgi:hypothetical protein
MEDLLIEDIDDSLMRRLEESARRHGRALNDEVIRLLALSFTRNRAIQPITKSRR